MALLVIVVSILKFRTGEIDYYNSDATWHTLLTIEAYNETPISEHLFLPIVSLGGDNDKGIPWGATVPDSNGNYYYTSFSPAGYFLPWLFIRVFHLAVNETSLYIFNTFLFIISVLLWTGLLSIVYKESDYKIWLCLIGGVGYVFAPELMHGMGIVYWHQSVLQVTLLVQILSFYKYITEDSKCGRYIFYLMSFINPYIEWTGYIANVGFALAEMIIWWNKSRKKAFGKAIFVGIITVASFIIFSLHYLLRVDMETFVFALKSRFMARNVTTAIELTDVIGGYFKSFLFLWVVLLILLIWCFIKNRKLELKNGILMLIISFPILENIVMKEHALSYSYDRMKAVFVLIFLICETAKNIFESSQKKERCVIVITTLVVIAGCLNLFSYINNEDYIWAAEYREDNNKIAEYVTKQYPDALYASDTIIRGYMNLLFGRGIYEGVDIEGAAAIAEEKGKEQIVYIIKDGYTIKNIRVYDGSLETYNQIHVVDHEVLEDREGYYLADWTDSNWTNGYFNSGNILLFYRQDDLLIDLLTHEKIIGPEGLYSIINIDYDDDWIRVEVDREAWDCMYPAVISFE